MSSDLDITVHQDNTARVSLSWHDRTQIAQISVMVVQLCPHSMLTGEVEFKLIGNQFSLTHCGLVTSYGDRDIGQHCSRWWHVAWWHQAITWTNIDLLSLRSSDFHLRVTLPEKHQPSITKFSTKIIHLNFYSNLPGANELTVCAWQKLKCKNTHRNRLPLFHADHTLVSDPTTRIIAW